jgi:hypothetical protein
LGSHITSVVEPLENVQGDFEFFNDLETLIISLNRARAGSWPPARSEARSQARPRWPL